jgi:hypothetical protein
MPDMLPRLKWLTSSAWDAQLALGDLADDDRDVIRWAAGEIERLRAEVATLTKQIRWTKDSAFLRQVAENRENYA